MSKLGGYVQRVGQDVEDHCLRARYRGYITLAHDPEFWKKQYDAYQPQIIVRQYFTTQPLPTDPVTVADPITQSADRLRNAGVPVAGVMGYNEVGHTGDGLNRLVELELRLIDLFQSRGLRYAGGNFSVSWPLVTELVRYRAVLERLVETDGWLALHQYGAPTMRGRTDLTLHHRALRQQAVSQGWTWPRIIISETGIDGGVLDGQLRGFRAFPDVDYLAELRWLLDELAADDDVDFACAFGTGMNHDWETFDIVGSSVERAVEQLTEYTPPTSQPRPIIRVRLPSSKVVTLVVEEYLRGVVPAEVYASWQVAALQAQAVAARTFAMYMIAHPAFSDADVDTTTATQTYDPAKIHANTDVAIVTTAGEVWSDCTGQYVSHCGRKDCPLCQGNGGYAGRTWDGRLCQYGAQHMATLGSGYKQILATYYGGGGGTVPGTSPKLAGYDRDGNVVDASVLLVKYNAGFTRAAVAVGHEVFRLVAVREKGGDTACIARVTNPSGNYENAACAWWWPDAPQQNPSPFSHDWERNYQVGMLQPASGQRYAEVGFGMGSGGVIHDGGGPHKMWVLSSSVPSDLASGIGWMGGTPHDHLDWEWVLVTEPDSELDGDVVTVLRNYLWNRLYQRDADGNFPYLAGGAFALKARSLKLLVPTTVEYRVTINGKLYAAQGFAGGFLYTLDGDWEHLELGQW